MRPSNRVVAVVMATLVCSAIAGWAKAGPASPEFVIRSDPQADPSRNAQPVSADEQPGVPGQPAAPVAEPAPVAAVAEPAVTANPGDATLAANGDRSGLWHPGVDALSSMNLPMAAASTTDALDGRDAQHAMVPLPTAAWTGLSTLAGLAVIRFARNFRRILN